MSRVRVRGYGKSLFVRRRVLHWRGEIPERYAVLQIKDENHRFAGICYWLHGRQRCGKVPWVRRPVFVPIRLLTSSRSVGVDL